MEEDRRGRATRGPLEPPEGALHHGPASPSHLPGLPASQAHSQAALRTSCPSHRGLRQVPGRGGARGLDIVPCITSCHCPGQKGRVRLLIERRPPGLIRSEQKLCHPIFLPRPLQAQCLGQPCGRGPGLWLRGPKFSVRGSLPELDLGVPGAPSGLGLPALRRPVRVTWQSRGSKMLVPSAGLLGSPGRAVSTPGQRM